MGRYDKYKDEYEAKKARDEEIKKNLAAWREANKKGDEAGMPRRTRRKRSISASLTHISAARAALTPKKAHGICPTGRGRQKTERPETAF